VNFDPKPLVLANDQVRLEPLAREHLPALVAAASAPGIFQWFLTKPLSEPAAMSAWFEEALRNHAAGTEVAFATVRRSDGRVVGSTRFMDLRRPHRALEIGNTWLAPEAQRTAVNTAAKYLMLRQAFEGWGAVRVQLKTDERNERSRAAIARLGATFEGILRNYQTRTCDGYVRNTAMFSITDREWPAVRAGLEAKLAR
jgi:RimJ/RimL family protein N-acetyltransferase